VDPKYITLVIAMGQKRAGADFDKRKAFRA
jgi:hypothetical protein